MYLLEIKRSVMTSLLFLWIALTTHGALCRKHVNAVTSEHHDIKHMQKFVIPKHSSLSDMPVLNDDWSETTRIFKPTNSIQESELPGAYGEEDDIGDDGDSGSGSGSGSSGSDSSGELPVMLLATEPSRSHQNPQQQHYQHPHKPETAARFGNDWHLRPGINPSAAFVTKELNHKGFKGSDKDVRESKENKHKIKKKTKRKPKAKQPKAKQVKKRINNKKISRLLNKATKEFEDVEDNEGINTTTTDDGSSMHEEDAEIMNQIKNIAEEIDKVERKRKEKEKEQNKSKADNKTSANNVPSVALKGLEGFGCPWSCFWTCQSYCPKECCNNPFNCSNTCREICTPYCKDICCAPGAKRLPKLQIPLLPARSHTAKSSTSNIELATKIKALKEASDYAVHLLGIQPSSCPAFCSRICARPMCRPQCCERQQTVQDNAVNLLMRRENFLRTYPTLPLVNPQLATNFTRPVEGYRAEVREIASVPVTLNSPSGGLVESTYCPPICRSSCIQQCPNECCTTLNG